MSMCRTLECAKLCDALNSNFLMHPSESFSQHFKSSGQYRTDWAEILFVTVPPYIFSYFAHTKENTDHRKE